MARLAGVDIPRDKRVVIALTYIYGIGRTRSHEILAATEINEDIRVNAVIAGGVNRIETTLMTGDKATVQYIDLVLP